MEIEFKNIGLKEKEYKIYSEILKSGSSLANNIAKKSKVLRASIYDYLDILLEKGFITYTIISGKKYFQAVSPDKILDNFREEKEMQEENLKEIIPKLISLQNTSKKNVKIEVFEGKEGMKSVMSYILKEKPKEILIEGSSGVSYKVLPYYMEHWHKQRIKQKICLRMIYTNVKEAKERIEMGPSLKLSQIKFSKNDSFSLTGTIIYNNKILITIWDEEHPLAISIESEAITKSYKENFELLWKIAKK